MVALAADEEEPQKPVRKRRVPFDPTKEPGVCDPLGFFDPAGFCPPGDKGNFRNLRAAELKHGRVAMLASVGLLGQSLFRLPFGGVQDTKAVPSGIDAMFVIPSTYGFTLILIWAFVMEFGVWKESTNREPGNFGDPFGLGMYDMDMRNRELNNGRFAMFAAIGILAAEILTGKDAAQQLGLR